MHIFNLLAIDYMFGFWIDNDIFLSGSIENNLLTYIINPVIYILLLMFIYFANIDFRKNSIYICLILSIKTIVITIIYSLL